MQRTPVRLALPGCPGVKLERVRKVLLIRLRRIGDVVTVTPCTRAVKEMFPDAHLSVLVEKTSEGILLGNPFVDNLIVPGRESKGCAGRLESPRKEFRFLLDLRREGFDLVINLHGGPRSAIQTLFSGARYRLGGFNDWHHWNWVYNIRPRALREISGEEGGRLHIVERHLATLGTAGIETSDASLVMVVTEEAQASLRRMLCREGFRDGDRIVTMCPAARGLTKRWREERFAELGDRLIEALGVRVVLASGPGEREVCGKVKEAMRREALDLGGLTSLQELAALLQRSSLFIGLDGGPVHIAAAVGVPVVALYGPTSDTWRPWTDRATVIRGWRPCLDCRKGCPSHPPPCMDSIGVDQVFDAALGLMDVP